jgi:hypothetical protein
MTAPEFLMSFYAMSQADAEEIVRELADTKSLMRLADNRVPSRAEPSPEKFSGAE